MFNLPAKAPVRSLLTALAILATVFGFVTTGVTPAAANSYATSNSGNGRVPVSQLHIVNWFPSDAGWTRSWTNYNHAATAADFAAIAALGGNAVRVIVPPYALGWPTLSTQGAAEFADVVASAKAAGLSLEVTLFDEWGTYVNRNVESEQWVRQLLRPYANDPSIALVELQSEINPYNSDAMSWARTVLAYLKQLLPAVPTTLSVRGLNNPNNVLSMMKAIPAASLDVISLHLYASLDDDVSIIRAAQLAANGRTVIVNEAGMSSGTTASTASDDAAAQYDQNVAQICKVTGLPPFAPWTLNDLTAAGTPGGRQTTQSFFGLRRTDRTWKPAASVVKAMFTSAGAPARTVAQPTAYGSEAIPAAVGYDGGFEKEAPGPDASGNLGFWFVTDRAQTGASGTAAGQGENGSRAGFLVQTGGDASAVPALSQAFTSLGASSVSVKARVRLVNATGSTRVAIAWFTNNTYVGQIESTTATNNSSSWQSLQVSGTVPAGATSYQVHLKSGSNRGVAYFDSIQVNAA